jgi:hypothetical protein
MENPSINEVEITPMDAVPELPVAAMDGSSERALNKTPKLYLHDSTSVLPHESFTHATLHAKENARVCVCGRASRGKSNKAR